VQGRAELAALVARFTPGDGIHETAVPRLALIRAAHPSEPLHVLHEPAVCIVAQGRKLVMLGDEVFDYGGARYLVVSVDLPVAGQVVEASPEVPYLCFRLTLDPAALAALLLEGGPAADPGDAPPPGVAMRTATPELLDAAARLVRLLGSPRDAAALAPLVEREILYRLLADDATGRLRQIALADGKLQQVNRAIGWIKRHFREPFRIETLAREAWMSPSALHQHFKAVTTMSPLQYQKALRLQEARRLMLASAMDAARAGYQVGYGSPSQFSREYARAFGAPPARDIARLRATPQHAAV
jgi:AraC-like DNA-binding protein